MNICDKQSMLFIPLIPERRKTTETNEKKNTINMHNIMQK